MSLDPVIVFVARLAIGALFLSASVQKVRHLAETRGVIAAYGFPEPAVAGLTILVIALELFAAVGTLLGATAAVLLAGALLAAYAAAMATNLLRGRRLLDCGCSTNRQPVSWALVIRNLCMLPIVLFALAEPSVRSLGVLDYTCVVGGALMLALLYGAANEIMAARVRFEEWV